MLKFDINKKGLTARLPYDIILLNVVKPRVYGVGLGTRSLKAVHGLGQKHEITSKYIFIMVFTFRSSAMGLYEF